MQVTETLNEGLKRKLNVSIPASELNTRRDARLQELSATANIRGFRRPEPYQGKGVRYSDEGVIKKETKKK